jgi:hypothetical protein
MGSYFTVFLLVLSIVILAPSGVAQGISSQSGSQFPVGSYVKLANGILRYTPSAIGKEITTIPMYGKVKILRKSAGDYYKVVYEGREGYIHSNYIVIPDGTERIEIPHTTPATYQFKKEQGVSSQSGSQFPVGSYVKLANGILRYTPSAIGKEITTIPMYGKVKILRKSAGDYYEVVYEGREGYIHSNYIVIPDGTERIEIPHTTPATYRTSQPNTTRPTQSNTYRSSQPTTARPTQSSTYRSSQPTTTRPTQSSTYRSSQPTTTRPTQSGTYRTYYRGPRGGCYYINSNGNKTYVDRSVCD